MPENDYIKNVHTALTKKVEGFNKPLEEFRTQISNPEYAKNVHTALTKKVEGFNKPLEEFYGNVGVSVKKKESTQQNQSPQQVQPTQTSSSGGQQQSSGLAPDQGIKPSALKNTQKAIKDLQSARIGFGTEVVQPTATSSGDITGGTKGSVNLGSLKTGSLPTPNVVRSDADFYNKELEGLKAQMQSDLLAAGNNEQFKQQVIAQYTPKINELESLASAGTKSTTAIVPKKAPELVRPENVPVKTEVQKIQEQYGRVDSDILRESVFGNESPLSPEQNMVEKSILAPKNNIDLNKKLDEAAKKDATNNFANIDLDQWVKTNQLTDNQFAYLKSQQEKAKKGEIVDFDQIDEFIANSSAYDKDVYQAALSDQTMADFSYDQKKETADQILSNLPDSMREYNKTVWELNSKARDLLSSYMDKGIKIDPKTGDLDLSGLSPMDAKYLESKMKEIQSKRDKLNSEHFASINDDIIEKKTMANEFSAKIKFLEKEIQNETDFQLRKKYQSQLNEAKRNLEDLNGEIISLRKSKESFFEAKPTAISEMRASKSAQEAFSALPKNISPKEKLDMYYRQLFRRTQELADLHDIDVDRLDVIGQNLRDWLDIDSVEGLHLTDIEKEYMANKRILQSMAPLYFNNMTGVSSETDGLVESAINGFNGFLKKNTNLVKRSETAIGADQLKTIQEWGFSAKDITGGETSLKDLEDRVSNVEWYSFETLGEALGTTAAIMADIAVGGEVLKVAKSPKIMKAIITSFDKAMDGTVYSKYLKSAVDTGIQFEVTGDIIQSADDELNFISGFAGSLGGELVGEAFKKMGSEKLTKYISSIFGSKSDQAVSALKRAGELSNRGIAETGEEVTQELISIYNDELRTRGFWEEVESKYGNFNDAMKLLATSYIMGAGFGMMTGKASEKLKAGLTKEQLQAVESVRREVGSEIANGTEAMVKKANDIKNDQELEKSAEEGTLADDNTVTDKNKETEEAKVSTEESMDKTVSVTEIPVSEEIKSPEIIQEKDAETEYKDSEGRFYSEAEVLKMTPEQLSGMTLQNPSEKVLETIKPTENNQTNNIGLSSQEQGGQESVQADINQVSSENEVKTDRVLQTQEKVVPETQKQSDGVANEKTKEEQQSIKDRNLLVSKRNQFNALSPAKKKGPEGRALRQDINKGASQMGLTVSEENGKIRVIGTNGKNLGKISEREVIEPQTKESVDVAKRLIDNGITRWDGDMLSPRVDLGISWADIRKGEQDIRAGKTDTIPAKRLIKALNEKHTEGDIPFIQGSGAMTARTYIPADQVISESDTNYPISEADQKIIDEKMNELAAEYDSLFATLDEETQKEILDNHEGRNQKEVGENAQTGESKTNVSNEEKAGNSKESGSGKEVISKEDVSPEKESFESVVTKGTKSAIDWLDALEAKLDEFGKENLGMSLPIPVMKLAIKAARLTAQTTGELSKIIDSAIQAVKESDFYKGLDDAGKNKAEADTVDIFKKPVDVKENVSAEEKPAPEIKEKTKPKYKHSSQTLRASKMQDSEVAEELKRISRYKVQNQEEFSKKIDGLLDLLGAEGAIDYINDVNNEVDEDVKVAVLTEAGARLSMDAMVLKEEALKNNDDALLAEADNLLERAMRHINNASLIKTKAGQINAYTRKTYEKYPSVFLMSKQYDFNKKNGPDAATKEDINELQDGIKAGVENIVDSELKDAIIDELKKKLADTEARLADMESSNKKTGGKSSLDQKVVRAKIDFSNGLAKFKAGSKSGQASVSISFLNQTQIEGIGEMISALIRIGGYGSASIVNKIYHAIKNDDPSTSIKREHIRQIGREIAEFESLHNEELNKNEQSRLDKLRNRLAELQKGEGEIDERVMPEDSDEVKSLKQQIKDERVLTPAVLRQIVKDHLAGKNPHLRSLAETIAKKSGKSVDEVQDLADVIEQKLEKKLEELVKKEHQNFIDKQNKADQKTSTEDLRQKRREGNITPEELAELEKRIEDSKSKKETAQIMKLMRMGGLSDSNEFTRAFEKRFGFRALPSNVKKQLDTIAFEIFELERNISQEVIDSNGNKKVLSTVRRFKLLQLQRKFNTLLDTAKPWTVAKVLKEIVSALYINMLSGPLTFVRAGLGGYSSGIAGSIVYTVSNANNPRALFKGMIAIYKSLPSAYRRAVLSRKTGLDMFGESALKGQDSTDTQGSYERTMLSGLGEAMDNKEYGKGTIKVVGQTLKVIHALGALDAFMNTVSGAYVGTVEKVKKEGLSSVDIDFDADYKSIASEEFKEMISNAEKEVDIRFPNLSPERKAIEINKVIRRNMGLTGSRLDAKKTYIKNRVQELRENQLGDYFVDGVNMAKDASLMGKPDGFVGYAIHLLTPGLNIKETDNVALASMKFLLNGLFKFVRITGQLANKTMNNIPVIGIANAYLGPGYNHHTGEFDMHFLKGKNRANPLLTRQRLYNNLIIIATTIGAYALMFRDDDEEGLVLDENRPFDMRAFGHGGMGGRSKNDRKYENFQNLSISFTKDKDGKWINYISVKLNPELSSIVATLGSFSDLLRGMGDEKELKAFNSSKTSVGLYKALGNNTKILTESSFSSLGRIFRNFQQEDNFWDGLVSAGRNVIIDNTKPLINPSSMQSITKTYQSAIGSKEKDAQGWKYLAQNLYGLDAFIDKNKTDVFGNEYPEANDYEKFTKEVFDRGEKRSEILKNIGLLYKFDEGVNISKRKFAELSPESAKGFVISYTIPGYGTIKSKFESNDESLIDEAQKLQETEFNRLVTKNYESLNSIKEKEYLEKALKEIQDYSVSYAKEKIVEKYINTKKIKLIE